MKIKKFIRRLINKYKWKRFKKENKDDKGYLRVNYETVLKAHDFFSIIETNPISTTQLRAIYITPTIISLYDLLYFTTEAVNAVVTGAGIPVKPGINNHKQIKFSDWLRQPRDSDHPNITLHEAVTLLGTELLKLKTVKDIPDTYIERKFIRVFECYLTLIEILGDLEFNANEVMNNE